MFHFLLFGPGRGPRPNGKTKKKKTHTHTPHPPPAPSERVFFCRLSKWSCLLFCCLDGGGGVGCFFAVWAGGGGGCCFFAVWAGLCFFCCLGGGRGWRLFFFFCLGGWAWFFLFCCLGGGGGSGVHSLTGLPGSSSSDLATKKTKQQKKKTVVPPLIYPSDSPYNYITSVCTKISGPQYRPQYTIIHISMRTPKKGAPNFGKLPKP